MFDGVFLNKLTTEFQRFVGLRINKVCAINETDYFFQLQKGEKLFFSLNSNNQHIRITSIELINTSKIINLQKVLKKYFESSIITKICQYQNDRILIITVINSDDLGYKKEYNLIIEFFGRNANLVITDNNDTIIEAYKRLLPVDSNNSEQDDRIILPKYKYQYPKTNKINPFVNNTFYNYNCYQGMSNLCYQQISINESLDLLYEVTTPTFISSTKKFFYAFDLPYIDGDRKHFDTLSQLLEYFYTEVKKEDSRNNEQLHLYNYINKEIDKLTLKISKQKNELLISNDNLKYEQIGNLLASNLYKVKKGDSDVIVQNFYTDNSDITIQLNPKLSPQKNLDQIFTKYNKAKRAISHINEQIIISEKEIEYLKCLLNQLQISKTNDLREIYDELNIKTNIKNRKQVKPNYLTYHDNYGNIILVGKNNLQNDYITHKLANKNDYFFHVQNIPGSHTIVKCEALTDDLIKLAATIAAYYSSYQKSTNVCVDYTSIKYVKKVPGMKGSFVTYKNQKSIFVKPDYEFIKANTK